ncbi:MAG TPA: ATP-binding protein [Verrucomicrobiae bacterium]|nr:ATP-binding protein [Verrucomicrobiae bacterium]
MTKISIGMRLTLWYLAIFALAQFVFGAGMWFILRHHLYDLVDDSLNEQVDDLRTLLQEQGQNPSLVQLRDELRDTYAIEHLGNYLEVDAENGEEIYRSGFLRAHPVTLDSLPGADLAVYKNQSIEDHPYRFIRQKLQVNGHVYFATMGLETNDAVETLAVFRSFLLMFAPLLLLTAAGGGYWLSHRALAPVDDLVRTARDISGVNLRSRLRKLETGDELQRLSDTLNEMLDRIETAFLRIAEFTADASHELRTPVSLIRTEAELALRRSRGEDEYKEALRHILFEAERTTSLIEQLLALARADSGRESLRVQPVNVTQTLRGVAEGWRRVATIRNLQFFARLDAPEAFVMGDEAALRRVADILLDNAFKYTPSPGDIALSLERKGGNIMIVVRDSGIGIASHEHTRIFERFYRVDKARSRAQGGAGLGLAIAQWLVTRHGGRINVDSELGHGTTFCVELPTIAMPVQNLTTG